MTNPETTPSAERINGLLTAIHLGYCDHNDEEGIFCQPCLDFAHSLITRLRAANERAEKLQFESDQMEEGLNCLAEVASAGDRPGLCLADGHNHFHRADEAICSLLFQRGDLESALAESRAKAERWQREFTEAMSGKQVALETAERLQAELGEARKMPECVMTMQSTLRFRMARCYVDACGKDGGPECDACLNDWSIIRTVERHYATPASEGGSHV